MSEENKDLFDLGSEPTDNDIIDPFAMDEEMGFGGDGEGVSEQEHEPASTSELTAAEAPATEHPNVEAPKTESPAKAPEAKEPKGVKAGQAASGQSVATVATSAPGQSSAATEQPFTEKPPVFEYAGATENIDDTSKTFDELRIEKASDFPELEDGKRVSWTVEYGKITKSVPDPKGTSIGKMKTDIEVSKEFEDSLKKRGADKNPACKVKPRVTAQSKGFAASYRGVFANVEEAEAASKVISIIPARDGKVYEIRKNVMGKFITPVKGIDLLSDVRAGFIPAPGIPLIPQWLMVRVVTFFRQFVQSSNQHEVLVNIYWDKQEKEFVMDVPEQTVTKASVESVENLAFAHERYVHYMDIHSHNSMKAFFSERDDADEKATRLYTVIGRLDKYFPDIKTRISNGGKFHEINPSEVFELISCSYPFPDEWKENVRTRVEYKKRGDVQWYIHGDDDITDGSFGSRCRDDGLVYGTDKQADGTDEHSDGVDTP